MSDGNETGPPLSMPAFERGKVISLFVVIFYVLLVGAGLMLVWTLRALIPPLLIALAIALTLVPQIDRLERQGWRRGVAIFLIFFLFLVTLIATLFLLVPMVSAQLAEVANNVIPASLLHATNIGDASKKYLIQWHVPSMIWPPILAQLHRIPEWFSTYLGNLSTLLPLWAGNLIWILLVPVMAFYLLSDYHRIVGKLLMFVKREKRIDTMRVIDEVVAVFGNYVRGVVIVAILDIVVIYVVLRVLHIRYAETVAVLSGILYAIPYLGAIISTILIALVTLATRGLLWALITTAVMVFIHQFLFDQIIGPRIIGRQVGLHPMLAIIAMLIGGTLLGVGGTLLAIPLAAAAQVILVHLYPSLGRPSAEKLSELYAVRPEGILEKEKREEEAARQELENNRRAQPKPAEPVAAAEPATEPTILIGSDEAKQLESAAIEAGAQTVPTDDLNRAAGVTNTPS